MLLQDCTHHHTVKQLSLDSQVQMSSSIVQTCTKILPYCCNHCVLNALLLCAYVICIPLLSSSCLMCRTPAHSHARKLPADLITPERMVQCLTKAGSTSRQHSSFTFYLYEQKNDKRKAWLDSCCLSYVFISICVFHSCQKLKCR